MTNPNSYTATATIRDTSGNVLSTTTFSDDKWQMNAIIDALDSIAVPMADFPGATTATVTADDGREWVFTCVKTAEVRK